MTSDLTLEHIDPRNGVLICGYSEGPLAANNEILADSKYNSGKQNRFVPYRVKDHPAPVTYGDVGEFLILGEWIVCEFGGDLWKEETRRIGFGSVDGGRKIVENGVGIHGMSQEERAVSTKKGGLVSYENRLGFHSLGEKEHLQNSSLGGKTAMELGVGLYGRSPEKHSEDSSKAGKSTTSQRWKCLKTGHVSTPGGLSQWQKKRNIDTSLRVRVA